MDKKFIVIFLIAVAALSVLILTRNTNPQNDIKIGAILPLTGDSAFAGISIQQGLEIAIDEINKEGGVCGRKIEVIFEDDKYDNNLTVTAANKMLDVDKIDVGIVSFVHGAKAVMPIFEQRKIPLLVAFDCNEDLAPGDYTFCTGFSTEEAGKKMAQFVFQKLNLRDVAIIYHQDEWSQIISSAFREKLEELGGEIVLEEGVSVGESDFKTIISKVKFSRATGLYLPFVPVNTDLFLRQSNESGLDIPIMSGDALIPDIIIAAGPAAENVYFTNIYAVNNEMAKNLSAKYREKYGEDAVALPMVAFGYDAMSVIRKAIELAGNKNSGAIKNALYKVDINGADGEIKFNADGLATRIEKIFQVKNGEAILVK